MPVRFEELTIDCSPSSHSEYVNKAHLWEKPGGIYLFQLSMKYQKPLYCLVWQGGLKGRDLIKPIMSNHNQKSIFSNSLLERSRVYWGWQICFPRNGLCVYENNIRLPTSQPSSHTLCFFSPLLRSIYHSVQLIIKLFLFLLPYIVVFNCMKYLSLRQIYWQFLINC